MTEQAPTKPAGNPGTDEFPKAEQEFRRKPKPKANRRFRRKRKVVK